MVESFHVTESEGKIALYAGMITSSFTFAEFSAGMFWGRMSDRLGRKPVLIMGLIGTAISMIVFGFSTNLPLAMFARALGGLLNGNIGVLQTTVAEIVKVKEHQPRAYSIMPFVWCVGSILGPAMGGSLAQPCLSYPSLFPRNTIFDSFPFLLPNLVCVVVLLAGIVVGFLFLEETHPEKKYRRDSGLALGYWLLSKVTRASSVKLGEYTETKSATVEDEFDHDADKEIESSSDDEDIEGQIKKRAGQKAFTRQVIFNIVAYGILA